MPTGLRYLISLLKQLRVRVLFPFVGDSLGGSHKSTLLLIEFLETKNIETIVVLHQRYEPLTRLLEEKEINFFLLPTSKLAGSDPSIPNIVFNVIRNLIPFSVFLLKHRINIVHGNDLRINLSWSLPSLLTFRKFVWHQRTVLSNSMFWAFIRLLSSHCIAISRYVFESLPKNIPETAKSMVYNPFVSIKKESQRINEIKQGLQIKDTDFIISYLGRVVKEKKIDTLIRSIPLLQESPRVKILIAGKGEENYLKYLKELSKDLILTNRIHFLGFVENVEDYLWLSDLVVCPGPKEGFGRVVVESMMTSTPVIASRSGAHTEIIQERENGLTYKLDDQEELKDKIQELINNQELYQKIKINSNKTFQSFSLKKHGDSIMEIYNS